MLLVAGIDPGLGGAIAVYDRDADALQYIVDIPTIKVVISGKSRRRLDMPNLREIFFGLKHVWGVALIVVEGVSGWGGKEQSASAAFQFGEVFGRIMTLAEEVGDVETRTPGVWKMQERVPLDAEAIVKKAEAEFPTHAALFRGPKGGPLHDRAEAAFLARYAARRVWPLLHTAASIDDLGAIDIDKLAARPKRGNPHAHGTAPVAKSKRKARKAK